MSNAAHEITDLDDHGACCGTPETRCTVACQCGWTSGSRWAGLPWGVVHQLKVNVQPEGEQA